MRKLTERLGAFLAESLTSSYDLVALKKGQMRNDAEIFKAIDTLKKAGIHAASGAGNNSTDILVGKGKGEAAAKVLKKAGYKVKG